jgi:hypothetical protein
MLNGLSAGSPQDLVRLAKSWLTPPPLKVTGEGYVSEGYDPAERGYVVKVGPGAASRVTFDLDAGDEKPLVNPAFVLVGWGEDAVTVRIGGKAAARGRDWRAGYRRGLDGTDLILWVRLAATAPTTVSLARGGG